MNIFAIEEEFTPSELVLNSASFGKLEDLKKAISEGGSVDYVRLDICPTLITTMRDYFDCLKLLLDNGARGDIPNRMGWTALHEAATKLENNALQILLDYPEQTNFLVRDQDGATALVAAMNANNMENANLLISKVPELINYSDNNGNTPLMLAILNKDVSWLEWCIHKGADTETQNSECKTASELLANWEEGMLKMEDLSPIIAMNAKTKASQMADKKALLMDNSDESTDSDNSEPLPKANPFGLGNVKKKNKG